MAPEEDRRGVAEEDQSWTTAPEEDRRGEAWEERRPLVLERQEREERTRGSAASRRLRKHCLCTRDCAKAKVLGFFPILKWLPRYQFRDWILGDVMSGVIVGILLVPQSIAYSLLAGQDPIYGLYTSFFSSIIYALLGTSRHISVGIFGVLCLLVGQVVDRELAAAGYLYDAGVGGGDGGAALLVVRGNNASLAPECDRSCYAIMVGATVTFTAGVYQVLMGLMQVGFVSVYLSDSMLSGFATGASLTILTSQLKYLLGLKVARARGWFTLVKTCYGLLANLGSTNLCDLLTSLLCLLVLVPAKELNDRFKAKLKAPIPFELFVVVAATLASHFGRFSATYGSAVAGAIPTGFLPPQAPVWWLIPSVAVDAFSIAVVGFAITVSLSEMFAKKHGYAVDANQEMYALGFCNVLPAFFRCFCTSAALTKTLVKESTGCQSQLSGLVTALVLLLVLLLVAPLFHSLQKCVLAVIIVVNLRGALKNFADVPRMWRADRVDAGVWLVTMATSALVNTELGLAVGVLVSAFCVLGRTQQAKVVALGRAPGRGGRELYEDLASYRGLAAPPGGVAVLRYHAPVYYANQALFKQSLYAALGLHPGREQARRRKLAKREEREAEERRGGAAEAEGKGAGPEVAVTKVLMKKAPPTAGALLQAVVLDCSAVLFLDSAGVDALKEVRKDYRELGVRLLLAQCSPAVRDALERGGYSQEGEVFFTITDAVRHAQDTSTANGDCDTYC